MVLNTVAVTGASGMLGRHAAAALRAAGFGVISYGRTAIDSGSWRGWDLTQWKTDDELDELFTSVDAIVHAGAVVPNAACTAGDGELFDANVRASLNLAHWAAKRDLPLVYVSGAIVYAQPNAPNIREDAPLGWSGLGRFYGLTKLLAEDVVRREQHAGLRLAIVRPSSIYGHGLTSDKTIRSFLSRACAGQPLELVEPVSDSADLIHAADVADAIVRVLRTGAWDTFNLASGVSTSMSELAETCIAVAGKGQITVRTNTQPSRPPISRFALNCELAATRLGWRSQISLADGIRAVLEDRVIVQAQVHA